jgi:twitching motility two-component system response regulator PilG
MPELDGYQTCTLIRNAEDTRNTPVVMLSSSDGIFDIAKGQARGATAHVTKIPPESVLRELIFNHTHSQAAA